MIWREFDVVVIGYGPVGATVANLLGQYGIKTAVFERDTEIKDYSRAVNFDDEVMRVFQYIGLEKEMHDVVLVGKGVQFLDKKGDVALASYRSDEDYVNGFAPTHTFYQPEIEQVLRKGVKRFPNVKVFQGHEVTSLTPSLTDVSVKASRIEDENPVYVRARYVIACDGAYSSVRSMVGIQIENHHFDQSWLIVAARILGNLELSDIAQQSFDDKRPWVYVPLPGKRVRWEFMLHPGEKAADVERPQKVRSMIKERGIDPDYLEITQAVVHRFHARFAKQWRYRHVILAGDAAHQMPPFLGQGLCEGIRDVHNLCWKLQAVLKDHAHPKIIHTYEQERREQVEEMMHIVVGFGSLFKASNPLAGLLRSRVLSALGKEADKGVPLDDLSMPDLQTGFIAGEDSEAAGRYFNQPTVETADGKKVLLDEVMGKGFAVIGLGHDPKAFISEEDEKVWDRLSTRFIHVLPRGFEQSEHSSDAITIFDTDGHIAEWLSPHEAAEFVVVRPDRYAYGVYSAKKFSQATSEIRQMLGDGNAVSKTMKKKKMQKGLAVAGVSALGAGLALLKMWTRDEL